MVKRLSFILALVLMLGICTAGYAEVQNIKVSGDLLTYALQRYRFNLRKTTTNNSDASSAEVLASNVRVKFDAELTDNVSATIRLLSEHLWGTLDDSSTDTRNTDVSIDLANVTLKEFLYSPLTLVVGRQELFLGDGLLVAHPWTNQTSSPVSPYNAFSGIKGLSSRKAFDAIVGVLDYDPMSVIVGMAKGSEGQPFQNGDDCNVYVLNAKYATDFIGAVPELTYVLVEDKKAEIANYSFRLVTKPIEDMNLSSEVVYQTQKGTARDDKNHTSDTAILVKGSYNFTDVKWTPSLAMDFMRLSGNWYKMFEAVNSPCGQIINGLFPNTNQQLIGVHLTTKPADDVSVKLSYFNDRLVEKVNDTTFGVCGESGQYYNMTDKKDLGNEFDMAITYDYTEDVQFGFKVGYFDPGNAFDKANRKSATQVCGTMKVTF